MKPAEFSNLWSGRKRHQTIQQHPQTLPCVHLLTWV